MFLAGIQKLSLLDYPGVVACTLFTAGCNFRCPWCHNAGLVLPEQFTGEWPDPEETLRFLEKRRGVLDGVCITGGEPLLHPEVPDFIRRIKDLGYRVKLDTNGSFPERLRGLAEEKLVDYVAMDIKNAPAHYGETAGVPGFRTEAVEESKNYLLAEPVDYEFRTTVVRGLHTEERLLEAADWIRGAKAWYLQQFRDSGALINADGLSAFSEEEMQQLLRAVQQKLPAAKLRGLSI
ncbi:MAG: anaerobic ribonucleoside-triphosphate reductase activating protein [Oscillospiraceae bacterium]|nr:anaerobic ribonucleoside-triphosphate reductase activating protein [Oscillospiraceae bacterium]